MSDTFDFGNAFEPEKRPHDRDPVPGPPRATPGPVPVRPRSSEPGPEPRRRRGQSLSWSALILAVVSAVVIGAGLFLAMDSVRFSLGHALSDSQAWLTMAAFASCGAILAFALSIFSVVTARPRRIAAAALILSFALPPMALVLGGTFGFSSVRDHAERAADDVGEQAMRTLATIESDGMSIDSVIDLIVLIRKGG